MKGSKSACMLQSTSIPFNTKGICISTLTQSPTPSISWHSGQANTGTRRHPGWSGAGLSGTMVCLSSFNTHARCSVSLISLLSRMTLPRWSMAWMLIPSAVVASRSSASKPHLYPANQNWFPGYKCATGTCKSSSNLRRSAETSLSSQRLSFIQIQTPQSYFYQKKKE